MKRHRSFKLSHSAAKDEVHGPDWSFPVAQQVMVLGISTFCLDGGVTFQLFASAALAYWVGVAIIMIRRRGKLTRVDKGVINYGFLLGCVIALSLFFISGFI